MLALPIAVLAISSALLSVRAVSAYASYASPSQAYLQAIQVSQYSASIIDSGWLNYSSSKALLAAAASSDGFSASLLPLGSGPCGYTDACRIVEIRNISYEEVVSYANTSKP